MKTKAWAIVVLSAALPVLPVLGGVFYSPVFNMPLQPAPSPSNGGFYWVLPDGSLYGPNYCLVPPFNPVSGFNNVVLGQTLFANLHENCVKAVLNKSGSPPPPRQRGIGGYTMDYSDPNTFKNFDATAPMINGYTPFGPNQQQPPPTYGNGPMPMPRYANYPSYQPPFSAMNSAAQAPSGGVYQAAYYAPGDYGSGYYGPAYHCGASYYGPGYYGPSCCAPGYYGPGYSGGAYFGSGNCGAGYCGGENYAPYGQDCILQVQAVAPNCAPPMPGYGNSYNPAYTNLPGAQYLPAMQAMPYYQTPMNPNCSMPYYQTPANPNYSMPYYQTPANPNYSMPQTCFPTLPNPSYDPPPCPDNPNTPRYFTNPSIHSPRDYFMWKETQEDKAARARKPLTVPQ